MIKNMKSFLSLPLLLILFVVFNNQAVFSFMDNAEVSDSSAANITIEQQAENKYNIEFRNTDIKDIIRYFAREYGLNIIADKDIEGTVTASLGNISIKEALSQILDSQNYTMIEIGNVIRVQGKTSPVTVFKLDNVSAKDISDNLTSLLSSGGKLVVDEATNSVMVADSTDSINMIGSFIQSVDVKGRQVLIEAKFVETTLGASKRLGIEWGTTVTASGAARPHTFPFNTVNPNLALSNEDAQAGETDKTNLAGFPVAADTEYTFGKLDFSQFSAVFRALLTDDNTKVISNPQVATLNNRLATMGVTTEYPLPTYEVDSDTGGLVVSGYEYKDIGITLNVTPFIASDDYITMTIEPTVGTVGETVSVADTGFKLPIINSKTATTKVTIKDGETIVIGGLISTEEIKSVSKIPLLGSIPLLGKIFSYEGTDKSSSELLIFVTPHILNLEGEDKRKVEKDKMTKAILAKAGRSLRDKDYDKALEYYQDVLESDPGNIEANRSIIEIENLIKEQDLKRDTEESLSRAKTLYNKGEFKEAKIILEDILRKSPGNKEALEYLELSSIKITKENRAELLRREADRFFSEEEYELAHQAYTRLLSLNPDDRVALMKISESEKRIDNVKSKNVSELLLAASREFYNKNYDKALGYYQDVLKLEPDNSQAKRGIDQVYKDMESLEIASQVESDLAKARTLYSQGRFKEADIILNELFKLEPQNREVIRYLALTSEALKQKQSLKDIWEEANKLYVDKEYELAWKKYNDILALDSADDIARQMVEKCKSKIEQHSRAKSTPLLVLENNLSNRSKSNDTETFLKGREDDPGSLYQSGIESYNKADYDSAIYFFERVLILDPANDSAYRYLEMAHNRKDILKSESLIEPGTILEDKEVVIRKDEVLTDREIRDMYRDAVGLYREKSYQEALERFDYISRLDSKYKRAAEKKIESCLESIKKLSPKDDIEEKYQLAMEYFKKDLYSRSIPIFLEVLELKPGYKSAKKFLDVSRERAGKIESLDEFEQVEIKNR
jgi:type IV pilus assembly protein PilQ